MEPKLHVAEIISIQASERLAEILDPVYETIDNIPNAEGYDCLETCQFPANRNFKEDYYGFTNASSISISCPEWLRRASSSSSSSIYNTSTVTCDAVQKDTNRLNTTSSNKNNEDVGAKEVNDKNTTSIENVSDNTSNNFSEERLDTMQEVPYADLKLDCGNCENMLHEIMQCIEKNDNDHVKLNPDLLPPNRSEGDKIVFVDQ